MKQRDISFDIIKCVAITLVVFGHTIQYLTDLSCTSEVYKFIYKFHMPLFMMISGYFSYYSVNKYPVFQIIRKSFKSLVLPSIIWGIILIPFWKLSDNPILYNYIYCFWFLKTLFIYKSLYSITKLGNGGGYLIALTLFLLVNLVSKEFVETLQINKLIVPFMFGIFLAKYIINFKYTKSTIISLMCLVICSFILDYKVRIPHSTFLVGTLEGVSISLLIIISIRSISSKINNSKFLDNLSIVGRKTKEIYILQLVILEVIIAEYYPIKDNYNLIYLFVFTIFLLCIFVKIDKHIESYKEGRFIMGNL